jgi:opacity protein-like surface antigen
VPRPVYQPPRTAQRAVPAAPAGRNITPPGRPVRYTRAERQAQRKFYMGASTGITFVQESTNSGASLAFTQETDAGYHLDGVLGLQFETGLRVEFELAYRVVDVHSLYFTGTGTTGTTSGSQTGDGTVSSMAMMFNGGWQFESNGPLSPYLQGGVGIARVNYADVKANNVSIVDDSAITFAWQIGVGATAELNENWLVDISYRLFSVLDPELTDVTGNTFDGAFTSHEVLLGMRYRF